jgi:hypothetical protein
MTYRLRKPDGSVVEAFRNPDGSWVEIPTLPNLSRPAVESVQKIASPPNAELSPREHVREFLRGIARRGGKSRAARHSHDEIAAWGRVRHQRNGESEK